MEELEDLLVRYRPKFLYTNPTFQNPTGRTLAIVARRELLDLAARYRLPIVEDDPYSELGWQRPPPPALFDLGDHHLVIRIGTFSKTLAGGLRLGWLAASDSIVDQLALIKQRTDVSSAMLTQVLVAEFLTAGHFDRHLAVVRAEHKLRHAAMRP
ncbi:hypothetical protein BH20CHL1_BH20CHL1_07090 [soil metagenome]